MKQLLIPVIIAVLAGVGGGSGFAYMRTAKAFVADSAQRADSVKAHPPSKVATTKPHADAIAAPGAEVVPMTPADSLRALEAARAGTHAAADTARGAKTAHAADTTGKSAVAGTGAVVKPNAKVSPPTVTATADLAEMVRAARNEAMSTALPEERLAKIFAAMSPKDAAKVMEQMPDSDVRSILALMSDRSAAAVLTQFPAPRAATITKGALRAPASTP